MLPKVKNTIQDCNINFLFGSGLSSPYLRILGQIESYMEEVEKQEIKPNEKALLKASLYKKYFDDVISNNLNILREEVGCREILENYKSFLTTLNSILLKRKSTILAKEINIFTTNIDIFVEKALEDCSLEFNDGFNGRFNPIFSSSNFKKSHFKKSSHYDNVSEIPVFNLVKLHGSLTWQLDGEKGIRFSPNLSAVKKLSDINLKAGSFLDVPEGVKIDQLLSSAKGHRVSASLHQFMEQYETLQIVNPTKDKFRSTTLDQTYYDLLRIYSNELEKESTVLFVMGFSFADEHIRELTIRAANSNPTLLVKIIAHSCDAKREIDLRFSDSALANSNIEVIGPPREKNDQGEVKDKYLYSLSHIQRDFFEGFDEEDYEAENQIVGGAT